MLVLHIGANKTGSTAIQEFLRLNVASLPSFGFNVAPSDLTPDGPVTGHHVWLMEELRPDIAAGRVLIVDRIERLFQQSNKPENLILSAENLANHNGGEQLFAEVAQRYDIRVILYIRRQDELELSSWQQWDSKVSADFWAWLIRGVGLRGDWARVLRAWEKIVPRENITVRLYERARMLDGDVIADFANVLGLSERLLQLQRPSGNVNPSYSEALLDLVKGNSRLFRSKHDSDFYNIVEQLTGRAYHRRQRESLITHQQRIAILERYRVSNEWVRANYFPKVRDSLFARPSPDDYILLGDDELAKQKWELAATLIHHLGKRIARN